jgi:hypothetical protein
MPAFAVEQRNGAFDDARQWVHFVYVNSMCHLFRGFQYILDPLPHRFPFTSFRASAVGYVVTSLRDFQEDKIGLLPDARFFRSLAKYILNYGLSEKGL